MTVKNEQFPEKQCFEGDRFEDILLGQGRFGIPASWKGIHLYFDPLSNF